MCKSLCKWAFLILSLVRETGSELHTCLDLDSYSGTFADKIKEFQRGKAGERGIQISITILYSFKTKAGKDRRGGGERPFMPFICEVSPCLLLHSISSFKSYLTWVDLWLLVSTLKRALSAFRKINSDFVVGSGQFQI